MCTVLMVLEVILAVLRVVLGVLHGAQRQCSEQMFGTDSVRNNVPSQLRNKTSGKKYPFAAEFMGERHLLKVKELENFQNEDGVLFESDLARELRPWSGAQQALG